MINIKDIYIRDPFIYVEDDVAYLVGTTDASAWGGPAKSFLGYKSKDLVNFEGPFVLFEANKNFWSDENYWAPELHKVNGKYLLVASFFKQGRMRRSQILLSDSPLGRYQPVKTPFTPEEWMSLDATLWEENGKLYTVFCHEWIQTCDGEMVLGELSDDYCSLVNPPIKLFTASQAPWVVVNKDFNRSGYVTDGPFIYKLKNGNLAMVWSSFSKDGYAVGISISSHGIKGPWIHQKEPLYNKDGGHSMIFNFKGKLYLSLHCPNSPHMMERAHFYEIEEVDGAIKIKE